jgi:hypothetical protein
MLYCLAVVRNMHVSHDPVLITHARDANIAGAADVQGAELSDGVAIANVQFAGFACIFFVLRNSTYRVELENLVVFANRGVPLDDTMCTHTRARTNAHVRTDDAVRPNFNTAV